MQHHSVFTACTSLCRRSAKSARGVVHQAGIVRLASTSTATSSSSIGVAELARQTLRDRIENGPDIDDFVLGGDGSGVEQRVQLGNTSQCVHCGGCSDDMLTCSFPQHPLAEISENIGSNISFIQQDQERLARTRLAYSVRGSAVS